MLNESIFDSGDIPNIEAESNIAVTSNDENEEQRNFEEGNLKEKSIQYLASLYNKRYKQNTKLRKDLACWARDLVSTYLVLVFFLVACNEHIIHLSDQVLITLLGTTTLNVLGLMYIAMRDLFNGNSEHKR